MKRYAVVVADGHITIVPSKEEVGMPFEEAKATIINWYEQYVNFWRNLKEEDVGQGVPPPRTMTLGSGIRIQKVNDEQETSDQKGT